MARAPTRTETPAQRSLFVPSTVFSDIVFCPIPACAAAKDPAGVPHSYCRVFLSFGPINTCVLLPVPAPNHLGPCHVVYQGTLERPVSLSSAPLSPLLLAPIDRSSHEPDSRAPFRSLCSALPRPSRARTCRSRTLPRRLCSPRIGSLARVESWTGTSQFSHFRPYTELGVEIDGRTAWTD